MENRGFWCRSYSIPVISPESNVVLAAGSEAAVSRVICESACFAKPLNRRESRVLKLFRGYARNDISMNRKSK
jgi:hypothetical protein